VSKKLKTWNPMGILFRMGLDSVELVISIEEAFSISIPDEKASKVVTMDDLLDLVWRTIQETHGDLGDTEIKWDKEQVWETLRLEVSRQLGIKTEKITPEARLIADLGMG